MIDCRIVGVSQGMDFETNTASTALILELPTGARVQVVADDATVETVIRLQVEARGVPQAARRMPAPPAPAAHHAPSPPPSSSHAPSDVLEEIETDDGPALVFGGAAEAPVDTSDYNTPPTTEAETADEEEEEEDEPPPPPKQETPKQAKKRLRRNGSVPSRTVPKDEHGYPIVSGPDPNTLTTAGNQDEDGIGSV